MAATTRIDEVNIPQSFDAEQFIREYFKPMRISKERKEIREEAARDFRDFLLFILALIATESAYNALNWAYIEEQFRLEMERAALEYARRSQALEDYIAEKASDFVSVTRDKDLSDPYWTSDERATYEAVNEANSVVGLSELQRAQERGAVEKRWRTERDNRVRFTHRMVDGESVELDGMFEVGDALMRYPGDFFHSVRESVNCRCGLEYLDEDGNVVFVGKKADKVNKTDEKVQYTNGDKNDILKQEKEISVVSTAVVVSNNVPVDISLNKSGDIVSSKKDRIHKIFKNSELENGLPKDGVPDSIADKVDDLGKVLQRRLYGSDGRAYIDYDTTNHGAPKKHPTGAHKHIFDYTNKNPHGDALPLTEEELKENSDIIQRGVNYFDEK